MAQVNDAYNTVCPYCRSCGKQLVDETFVAFVYRSRGRGIRRLARNMLRAAAVAVPAICVSVELHPSQPAAGPIAERSAPAKRSIEHIGPWVTEVRLVLH
jgi:predicted RNA-binding Zn-ribbon protein involved in translation (DUF1610 family)